MTEQGRNREKGDHAVPKIRGTQGKPAFEASEPWTDDIRVIGVLLGGRQNLPVPILEVLQREASLACLNRTMQCIISAFRASQVGMHGALCGQSNRFL